MSLEQMIRNGTTELQKSYELFIALKEDSNEAIKALERQLDEEKAKLKSICKSIERCHNRASEQGYPNLFK